MPSMRDIKESIGSKKKTRQITKAMEMVSAAKLNRAQMHAKTYTAYTDKLREVVGGIAAGNNGSIKHPMLQTRPVKKTGYLVITADMGLAGAYNNSVLKYVYGLIQERHQSSDEYKVFVVGKVGVKFFKNRNIDVTHQATDLPERFKFDDVKSLAREAVGLYAYEEIDELYMVYNHFVSAINQQLTDTKLLPLSDIETHEEHSVTYEYEPDSEEVLKNLLPLYAEGLIYGALLDARAAEHAARMTAMRNSTDNATELIDKLTLSFNSARQAAITQELSEIVGGASALE
ncbi:F0F1 ATP synthase subunit gamma [Terrilactibacillus sp. BCM23-1]|uniref:ATP synthase gamma chain n=1 Tax=Terrilactibacillus tamarindi TaxID=2599694 RepID=A0A6N8CLY2_9BACI|nr:ATP synthase F1 subunit gamma [Terrilactibacillus tamarindi]MTT31002.1 F0F1 ATP synthase subunit gamma [Terrilactibacillus tamarindi]